LIWSTIILICESQGDDSVFREYNGSAVEEVKSKYVDVINNSYERFEFVAKVISDFSTYSNLL
jgi:hypothetical protein